MTSAGAPSSQVVPPLVFAVVAVWLWPVTVFVAVTLAPFYILISWVVGSINFARAARFRPARAARLAYEIAVQLWFVCSYAPLFASVAWYYVMRAPRDHVRKGIPYTRRLVVEAIERQAEAEANAQRDPMTATPTLPSPAARAASPIRCEGDDATPIDHRSLSPSLSLSSSSEFGASVHTPTSGWPHRPTRVEDYVTLDVYGPVPEQEGASSGRNTPLPAGGLEGLASTPTPPSSTSSSRTILRPVVVFVYGGAWASGRPWYYATVAKKLRATTRAVVVVPEYEVYPSSGLSGMVVQLHRCLQWVQHNIRRHGGDPRRVTVAGHSAGAHLIAEYLVRRAMVEVGVSFQSLAPHLNELTSLPAPLPIPLLTAWPRFRYAQPSVEGLHPEYMNEALGASALAPDSTSSSFAGMPATSVRPTASASFVDVGSPSFPHPPLYSVVLFAGVYDLHHHVTCTETERCLELIAATRSVTGGHWRGHSPTGLLEALERHGSLAAVVARMPARLHVYHPELDRTVSMYQAQRFADVLSRGRQELADRGGVIADSSPSAKRRGGASAVDTTHTVPGPVSVQVMSGVDHSGVVIGPMLQDHTPHPTVVAIGAAMSHRSRGLASSR